MNAFYEAIEDSRYRSLPATAGPWDIAFQHAGPPSALLLHAVARETSSRPDLQPARITVDVFRPVPVEDVMTSVHVLRSGRRTELAEATLTAGAEVLMRLTALRVMPLPDPAPRVRSERAAPALPPPSEPPSWPGANTAGYLSAVEWRFVSGAPATPGPARAWLRTDIDLVAGTAATALEHLLVVADSGSGISTVVDARRWSFMNADLTVVVDRPPATGWLFLDAETSVDASGVGAAWTTVSDAAGEVGHVLQTLVVSPRG